MSCCQSSHRRAWYIFVVSLWLLLTVIRQILDSIGRLWIPIVFNSFQIFSCISGLIAVIHWQKRLLIIFTLLNFTSILYNIALILWYNELFAISRDVPILSAGLPYSYSFFLRYTPSCKSYYNLTNLHWIQLSCIVPYYHVEGAQALLHIIMANLSILLSILIFSKQNFKTKRPKKQTTTNMSSDEKCCRTNDEYFMSGTLKSNQGHNQGYSERKVDLTNGPGNEQSSAKPENGYIRHSTKKLSRKCTCQNSQQSLPIKRSNSTIDSANEMNGHFHCQQSYEPMNDGIANMIYTSNRSQIAIAKAVTKTMASPEFVHRSGSLKNFKMPTTEGVRRILSREEINLVDNIRTNNICTNSPNNNLKSLVSFDPKSNILLRIHSHIDDDDEDNDNDNNDDRNDNNKIDTYHIDVIQRYLQQQQQQQQRITGQISSFGAVEQIQNENSKYPATNKFLLNYKPSDMIFGLNATGSRGYCHINSFDRCYSLRSPNSLQQQQSKYDGDIMYDERKQGNTERPSMTVHQESPIKTTIPIFNNNDFFV